MAYSFVSRVGGRERRIWGEIFVNRRVMVEYLTYKKLKMIR